MKSYILVAASVTPPRSPVFRAYGEWLLGSRDLSFWYCLLHLNPYPFDFIEGDFIGAAVVELGGAGGGVIGHGRGLFQRPAIL